MRLRPAAPESLGLAPSDSQLQSSWLGTGAVTVLPAHGMRAAATEVLLLEYFTVRRARQRMTRRAYVHPNGRAPLGECPMEPTLLGGAQAVPPPAAGRQRHVARQHAICARTLCGHYTDTASAGAYRVRCVAVWLAPASPEHI